MYRGSTSPRSSRDSPTSPRLRRKPVSSSPKDVWDGGFRREGMTLPRSNPTSPVLTRRSSSRAKIQEYSATSSTTTYQTQTTRESSDYYLAWRDEKPPTGYNSKGSSSQKSGWFWIFMIVLTLAGCGALVLYGPPWDQITAIFSSNDAADVAEEATIPEAVSKMATNLNRKTEETSSSVAGEAHQNKAQPETTRSKANPIKEAPQPKKAQPKPQQPGGGKSPSRGETNVANKLKNLKKKMETMKKKPPQVKEAPQKKDAPRRPRTKAAPAPPKKKPLKRSVDDWPGVDDRIKKKKPVKKVAEQEEEGDRNCQDAGGKSLCSKANACKAFKHVCKKSCGMC